MMKPVFKVAGLLLLALLASGCITTAPTPGYARAGDLVQVGLGGVKRNSSGKTLVGADVNVTITDSASTVHDVAVVGLFRAYADHTSWYARDSLDRADVFFGNVEPYDGMWWATLQLTNPTSGAPLPLATGAATIAITSSELTDTGWEQEGTLSSFPIEILPGSSLPSNEELYQYQAYRPQRALTIKPDTLSGITDVGGLQVSVTFNTSTVAPGPSGGTVAPTIVPISHDPNISLLQSTVDNGDGTQTVTAMITNPNGFVPNADLGGSWSKGKSTFADLELALVATDASSFANWQTNYWIESAESFYVDSNGDAIGSVSPVLGLSF